LREDERIHPVPDESGRRTGHGRRMLRAYERWLGADSPAVAVLRLLGLFDRPAQRELLDVLRTEPVIPGLTDSLVTLSDDDWQRALNDLADPSLIARDASAIDSHPLLREHFGADLRGTPNAWRVAHHRLYEHLCETTKEGDQPTLEDLQPLYQAVVHGCHAGRPEHAVDNVYEGRICRGEEYYSGHKLGAVVSDLATIACFFDSPWSRPCSELPKDRQFWLLNEAGFLLGAVGRLAEAIVPMRAAVEGAADEDEWQFASRVANNLSEIELKLGNVTRSADIARRSIVYADSSARDFWGTFLSSLSRAHCGDALHAAGNIDESKSQFMEAERLQALRQPQYPQLCSVQGFWWCDLMLAPAEREAWRTMLGGTGFQPVEGQGQTRLGNHGQDGRATCRTVTDRATQTLKIAEGNTWLLDIALDHLTLARAALYESLHVGPVPTGRTDRDRDSNGDGGRWEPALRKIEAAVSGIHRAGTTDSLPRGLLTRAWQRSLSGARTGLDSAQSDLDEVWEIASRGPMPLFLADIHLHRARLFGMTNGEGPMTKYPWDSVEHDLSEARRLIEKHGYGRRTEELEDAEIALLGEVGGV